MSAPRHPRQPVVLDADGVPRFHRNQIVAWMLDRGREGARFDMNSIASNFDRVGSARDDMQQLAQLIGYSVSGYGDLSYHDAEVRAVADVEAACLRRGMSTPSARVDVMIAMAMGEVGDLTDDQRRRAVAAARNLITVLGGK